MTLGKKVTDGEFKKFMNTMFNLRDKGIHGWVTMVAYENEGDTATEINFAGHPIITAGLAEFLKTNSELLVKSHLMGSVLSTNHIRGIDDLLGDDDGEAEGQGEGA